MTQLLRNIILSLVLCCFGSQTVLPFPAQAQSLSATPVSLRAVAADFTILKGIKIFPQEPFRFDFLLNSVDDSSETEILKLVKYFMASLTIPEGDLWVNLSPYESDRIIPDAFGSTEMGRDLLAQDYVLKQLTAALMNPEGETGKKFWERIYEKAYDAFGTTDILVDTFNKVWIVSEKVDVYQNHDTAYIVDSKLKVMLEADYLAQQKFKASSSNALIEDPAFFDITAQDTGSWTETFQDDSVKKIIHDVILPAIEEEVNHGESFAPLRQIYASMILAKWYENHFKKSVLGVKYIDQKLTLGIEIENKNEKFEIYEKYVTTFKQDAYDILKEEYDPASQQVIPKKYFSGGVKFDGTNMAMMNRLPLDIQPVSMRTVSVVLESDQAMLDVPKSKETQIKGNGWRKFKKGISYLALTGLFLVLVGFLAWKISIEPRIKYEPFTAQSSPLSGDYFSPKKEKFPPVRTMQDVVERLALIQNRSLTYEDLKEATFTISGNPKGTMTKEGLMAIEAFLKNTSILNQNASFSEKFMINDFKGDIIDWLYRWHQNPRNPEPALLKKIITDLKDYHEEGSANSSDFQKYFPNADQNEVLSDLVRVEAYEFFHEEMDFVSGKAYEVVDWFVNTWGTPYDLDQSLENIRKAETAQVLEIPLSRVRTVLSYRFIKPEVLKYIKESAQYHGVSPRLLVLAIKNRYGSSYPVNSGLDLLETRGALSQGQNEFLQDHLPQNVLDYSFDSETMRFLGGVVVNGHTKSGISSMRNAWVKRNNAFDRFRKTSDMSDQMISWKLWDPKYSVEAIAALWAGLIKDSREAYMLAMQNKAFSTVDYKDTKARRYIGYWRNAIETNDPGDIERIEYYKLGTPIDVFEQTGEPWLSTIHHPVEMELQRGAGALRRSGVYRQTRSPMLTLHEDVAMSGLFGIPNQSAIFTEVNSENDLLILKELLQKAEDDFIRKGAITTLEKIVREGGDLAEGAEKILKEERARSLLEKSASDHAMMDRLPLGDVPLSVRHVGDVMLEKSDVGGIDLNNLNMQTSGEMAPLNIPDNPAIMQPIFSLTPRILHIGDVNLLKFLGLNETSDQPHEMVSDPQDLLAIKEET